MADIQLPPGMSPEELSKYLTSFLKQKNLDTLKREALRAERQAKYEEERRYAALSGLSSEQKRQVIDSLPIASPWLVYKAPFDFLPEPPPKGLIVWREWNTFNGFLISPSQHYLWESPIMRANEAPKSTNSTGLYSMAFNPILGINLSSRGYSQDCGGLCECLGETVIHSDGRVRSAELRVLCLFAKGEDNCASLAGRYGIPTIPQTKEELLGSTWKTFIRDQYIDFMKNHPMS